MNLKKSISVALALRSMNRVELAAIMGISRQRVYAISNQKRIEIETLIALAKAFDMKVSEFIALGEQ